MSFEKIIKENTTTPPQESKYASMSFSDMYAILPHILPLLPDAVSAPEATEKTSSVLTELRKTRAQGLSPEAKARLREMAVQGALGAGGGALFANEDQRGLGAVAGGVVGAGVGAGSHGLSAGMGRLLSPGLGAMTARGLPVDAAEAGPLDAAGRSLGGSLGVGAGATGGALLGGLIGGSVAPRGLRRAHSELTGMLVGAPIGGMLGGVGGVEAARKLMAPAEKTAAPKRIDPRALVRRGFLVDDVLGGAALGAASGGLNSEEGQGGEGALLGGALGALGGAVGNRAAGRGPSGDVVRSIAIPGAVGAAAVAPAILARNEEESSAGGYANRALSALEGGTQGAALGSLLGGAIGLGANAWASRHGIPNARGAAGMSGLGGALGGAYIGGVAGGRRGVEKERERALEAKWASADSISEFVRAGGSL